MNEKYAQLISNRIDKLEEKDFDLEAWKSSVVSILTRIFGPEDPHIRLIEDLKIDYSSWALRDATSSYNPMETCKKKGREVLSAIVEELTILGLPAAGGTPYGETLKGILSNESLREINGTAKSASTLRLALKKEKKESLVDAIVKLLDVE